MLQGHMPGEGAEGTHLEMGDSFLLEAGLAMFTCKASGTLRGLKVFLPPQGASAWAPDGPQVSRLGASH